MLDFKLSVQGVATIDLTWGEDVVEMPPYRGNIAPSQKDNTDRFNFIPNTSSIREEPWTCTACTAPPSVSSTAPEPLTSALPLFFLGVEKSSFSLGCLEKVRNLVLKESTHSTLVSIGKDEAASHIEVTVTQAFEVKTQKESSGEESDDGDIELDYEDDDKASVLPDEEDEEAGQTADDGVKVGDRLQAAQTSNPSDIDDEEAANTQETTDEGINGKRPAGP